MKKSSLIVQCNTFFRFYAPEPSGMVLDWNPRKIINSYI